MPSDSRVLEVDRRGPLDGFTMVRESIPPRLPGTVLLAVERFSVAANNLGYVLFNDVLRTLDAFPASAPHRARVPVWGFAEVIDADPSVAAPGTRVAGFLPMATHTTVRATATETGLLSVDEHRVGMLPIYRRLTPSDAGSRSVDAEVETVLLPVYPFAALLAADVAAMGARTVVVTSASSRSAGALSRLLTRAGLNVVGLTSGRHRSAARAFGVYDRIFDYEEVDRIDISVDTVYVDVAGSADVTGAVHQHLGPHLTASVGVGGTHLRSLPSNPGPSLSTFNTGSREEELVRQHGWPTVQSLYQAARRDLIEWSSHWLEVNTVNGLAGTGPVWEDIVAGESNPLTASVIQP